MLTATYIFRVLGVILMKMDTWLSCYMSIIMSMFHFKYHTT